MQSNVFAFICFILCLGITNAQTEISGVIKDKNNHPIESANVIVYGAKTNIIKYTYTKTDGTYSIKLKPNLGDYIILSVHSLGFQKKTDTLKLNPNKKKHLVSFNLKEEVEQLNEVLLLPTEKISKEGSVFTYKVKAFNNGTEQTVEDVLKRLPGIEVLKNGTIKAHGRFIDKLLIEGEDMFDKKYTILSKNLDAKVLDEVQILEDFEDNPILAKVLSSEKIAINLVLKDNYKNIWFGNISAGIGNQERIKLASNIGLIRKKIKFFNFNNYNNLGTKALDQLEVAPTSKGKSFREQSAEPNVNPLYSIPNNESNTFKEGQSTFNKAFINSLSFVTSLKSSLKLRGTGHFTNDIQEQLFSSETNFNTGETAIVHFNNSNTNRKNSIAGGELELKYASGEKSYLKNVLIYNNKPKKSDHLLLFNSNDISEKLKQKEHSFYNHLNFSYLLGKKNVLHSYFYLGENEITQEAHINSPLLNNLFTLPVNALINHSSTDKTSIYGGKTTMLMRLGKLKSNMELGYESLKENRNNKFRVPNSGMETEVDSLQNKTTFKQQKIQFKSDLKYDISKKIELSGGLSLDYIDLNTGVSEKSKWLLSPKINLRLKNIKIGHFSLMYKRSYIKPQATLFLKNYQLNSYQSFKRGAKNIHFPQNETFSFLYQISNEMQTQMFSIRTQYVTSDGQYSAENQIGQNLILSTSQFVDNGDIISSNINYTSYFKKLNLSTNLGTSQSWTSTLIKVNTPEFKPLKTHTSSYFLSGTTYFKLPVNLNFKLKLNSSESLFNSIKSKTHWESFEINFTYKLSNIWIASLNNKFYMMKDSNYSFIDFKLNHNPEKSRFSYLFVLNNLANENIFSRTYIDEYKTYKSNVQLLPRYAFFQVKYRF